jgi:hypothetical protein
MAEVSPKNGDRSAKDLAHELLPYLEAVANLHYLLDIKATAREGNPPRGYLCIIMSKS